MKEAEIRELAGSAEIASSAAMSRDDLCKFVLNNGENALCRQIFGLKPEYSCTAEEQLDLLRTRKDFMMTEVGENNVREILNGYDNARAELKKFADGTDGKDSVSPETAAAFLRGASLLHTIQKGEKVDMEYLNTPGIAAKQLTTALASDTAKHPLTKEEAAQLLTPEGEKQYEHRFRKDLSDLLLEKLSPKLSSPASMRTELEKRRQELEPVHPEAFK